MWRRPWLAILPGSAIIGFWYWCGDQYVVPRVPAGKNQRESRRGTIRAGFSGFTPGFVFLVPGMIAFAPTKTRLAQTETEPRHAETKNAARQCVRHHPAINGQRTPTLYGDFIPIYLLLFLLQLSATAYC